MNRKEINIPRAVYCARNNLWLGLKRSYFMDWALASGLSKSTASSYWNRALKIFNAEKKGTEFKFNY